MTLAELNDASAEVAKDAFLRCCGSSAWAGLMAGTRPFATHQALHEGAERLWSELTTADWLEAFSAHPKIGAVAASRWSTSEQIGMSQASIDLRASMADMNEKYQRKFGFIFIVCATGRPAEEMHRLIKERVRHEAADEIQIAAREQSRIMHLRLDKLLAGD